MAGQQNKINFEVDFIMNRSNLQQLQTELTKVVATMNNAKAAGKLTTELKEAGTMAKQLSSILETSFNHDLGTLNLTKFNEGLKRTGTTLEQVKSSLTAQGTAGATAWNKISTAIMSTNVQLRQSNKLLNDMATTMTNTLKWGVASSILNTMSGAIRDAYSYSKQLDTSLTSIRIVTGDSADEMARFAEQANSAAKNLGATTLDYTKSALSFYQQGLDDEAVANRTEATIKAANVTGTRAEEVAQDLTAVWNGFQAQIGSEVDYVDKLAAVADSSASNLAELATAMSKVASVANNMGVDMDQLTAQISTIIATTRQAPETVGNALKTIYARINDIKTGSDEAEISLGNYTGKMASLGINVLDATGHLRDTGEVMEEIGSKWSTMSREQQVYLAQTMAGQRQMNNLIALFDNWTQYSDMLNVSLNAQGTLDEKNNRYLESTQAHLNELKATYQDLFSTLINTNELNTGIDTIRNLVQVVDNFLEGFGGGIKSLMAFGAIAAFVFRDQIGSAIGQAQANQMALIQNTERLFTLYHNQQAGLNLDNASAGEKARAVAMQEMLGVATALTEQDQEQLIALQDKIALYANEEEQQAKIVQEKLKSLGLDADAIKAENSITEQIIERRELAKTEVEAAERRYAMAEADLNTEELTTELYHEEMIAAEELEQSKAHLAEIQERYTSDVQAAKEADAAYAAQQAAQVQKGQVQSQHNDIILRVAALDQAQTKTQMLTSSVMMLTTAWGTLSSLMRTWTDENATMGEKISQTIMSLGFALPMLINSYNTLSVSAAKYAATSAAVNLAAEKQFASNTRLVLSEQQYVLALQRGLLAEGTYITTKSGKIIVTDADTAANIRNQLSLKGSIATIFQNIAARQIHIPTIVAETLALENETVALSTLMAAALPYVAIISALTVGIYALVRAYDAQTDRAKAATQAAHEAKEKASELSDQYFDLKSSLDSLKDARSTLSGLKEGTQEWKEAVLELNEQVLALVDKYPELQGFLENKDGVLGITQEGIDQVLDNQLVKVQAAQNAAITAQVNASKQQALVDAQELGRETDASDFLPGLAMSAEGIYNAAQVFAQNMGAIMDSNADHVKVFAQLAGITEQQAAALLENTSGLLELNSTAQGIQALEESRAATQLGDNERYQKSEYQDAINEEYNRRYNEIGSQLTEDDMRKTKQALADVYSELTGITIEEEELKNLTKEDLLERISNYRKTQELAKQENDIITAGEAAGKKVEESMSAFEQYGQQLIDKFNNEIPQADEKTYGQIKSASESIGENGILSGDDNISAIEGALTAAGRDMNEFFTKMPDGTYKLKTSADEFRNAIERISMQPFLTEADALEKKIEGLTSATQMGVDRLTSEQNGQSGQQSQLDFLAAVGYEDTEQLGIWRDQIADQTMSKKDIEDLAAATQDYIDKFPELQAELSASRDRAAELREELDNMAHRDEEIKTEDLEKLSNYLEASADKIEGLADNIDSEDYDEVAESLLRYKDAVEEIDENYSDWIDTLENGDIMDQAEAIDEIKDSMSDLLDLPYDSLSDDFVTNAENMDLMRRAAEGDEEAYNQLAEAAGKDILAQVGIDDSQFEIDKANIISEIESFTGQKWDDIEVGAELNDANFLAGLTEMVNAAGMTADQATDYLSSMGVDAKVIEKKVPKENRQELIDVQPHIDSVSVPVPQIAADGSVTTTNVNVPTISFEGKSHQALATSEEGVTSLEVTSANKKSGGGFKHQNIGGGGKSKGGGGGGGKKGGGGSAKKVNPAKKKDVKRDPYHDVNRQLGIVEDNLKKLQKEEKKLTGQQYLDNLVKQNKELEKQRKLIKQKADIATTEILRQQQELSANYGFGFDADGNLTNYFGVLNNAKAQVDALYAAAQAAPSEENNAHYQKAVEDYEAMMKAIDAYEKDLDIYNKQLADDLDTMNQMIENNIKRFNYVIDLHLDTADFEKEYKEFRRDILDQIKEDDYINLSSYGLSIGQDTLEDAKELVQHVQDIQNAIQEMQKGNYNASPYHDDMVTAMEDLQKYTDELMQRGEDIADIQEDIHDNWMDAIDDAQDAFDEQKDEYDQINDLIEHNLDMLEMLHGDEAYGQMASLYQQQADNSMKNIQLLAKERDFWFQQMNSVAEGSDAWKEYRDNWEDAVKDLNSSIKDAADYFYNRYEAIFNQLAKQLKDTFAGGDWNKRQTLWEDFLDDDDRYLDSLSRANGTYNLILKTQDAISNANLKHQRELNKWLDATTKNLENQTELRQIDLDIAEKELDIILKRQALEDAQNNKTKMRLRRDSQGNYRYQYVADTNDVAQKQQELRDAIEDLRLLVKEDFKDTVDRMYDQMESFAEEAADISEKYGFNTEEWNDQMALLQERYIKKTTKTANDYAEMMRKLSQATGVEATELFGQMGDEFMAALGMDSDTYKVFEQMFKPGGEYVDLIDGFITEIYTSSFDGVAEDVKDTFNEVTNLLPAAVADLGNNLGERIRDMLAQFMSDASDNQQEYVKNLEDVQSETGQHFDDLTTNMESTIQATEDLLLDNDKLITSYGDVINKVQEFANAIAQVVEQYKALSEAQINSTANMVLGDGFYQNGTTVVARYGVNGEDIRSIDENVDSMTQVLRQLSSYDEGGWTNGGGAELAVVHPNEYVLTSQDAPNMLAAAQIASRVMDRVADLKAAAMSQVGGAIGGLFTAVSNANENNMSEQQIIINADFPAVESAREIKQAFNELVNLASQRASGNRRTY